MNDVSSRPSRPLRFGWAAGLPISLLIFLLIFDPTPLDFAISNWFYQPDVGFAGKRSYVLENILHDWAKQGVIAFGVLAILGFIGSWVRPAWAEWRRPLGYLILAMGISTAIVNPLKTLTKVHCPWSLVEYGGKETHTELLQQRAPTVEKGGRCWPAGHASSGFTLFALFFFLRDWRPRWALAAFWFAFVLGNILGIGRVMQGAHFFSHQLWTAGLDWLICLMLYRWLLYRPLSVTKQ
ncbi:MAG: phosphatase PAP2 family protein [Pseudomonas sp.]